MVWGGVVLLFLVGLIGPYLAPSTAEAPTGSNSTQTSSPAATPARTRLTVVEMHTESTSYGVKIVGTVRNSSDRPFNGYLHFNLYDADDTVVRSTLAGITQLPAGQTCRFESMFFDSAGVAKYGVRDETDLTLR